MIKYDLSNYVVRAELLKRVNNKIIHDISDLICLVPMTKDREDMEKFITKQQIVGEENLPVSFQFLIDLQGNVFITKININRSVKNQVIKIPSFVSGFVMEKIETEQDNIEVLSLFWKDTPDRVFPDDTIPIVRQRNRVTIEKLVIQGNGRKLLGKLNGLCENILARRIILKDFDTSQVTCMKNTFYNCLMTEEINIECFTYQNVYNTSGMFAANKNLREIKFNTSPALKADNLENVSKMFMYNTSLRKIDLRAFGSKRLYNALNIFEYCENLEELDITGWDTRFIEDIRKLFYGLRNIKKIIAPDLDTRFHPKMQGVFRKTNNVIEVITGEKGELFRQEVERHNRKIKRRNKNKEANHERNR